MLLVHSGLVGRTKANKILYVCLSEKCLDEEYEDLSSWVTSSAGWARRSMDRPPRMHRMLWEPDWQWRCLLECYPSDLPFAPDSAPADAQVPSLQDPDTGVPLSPPHCWRRPQLPGLQQAPASAPCELHRCTCGHQPARVRSMSRTMPKACRRASPKSCTEPLGVPVHRERLRDPVEKQKQRQHMTYSRPRL